MDWVVNANGKRHFIHGAKHGEDLRHVALKLLAFIYLDEEDAISEPKRSTGRIPVKKHRGYRPDLLSRDGKRWGECGDTPREKILDLMGVCEVDEVFVMCKGSQNKIPLEKLQAVREKHKKGAVLKMFHWRDNDIDWLEENLGTPLKLSFQWESGNKLTLDVDGQQRTLVYELKEV